jgi:hypothetical protein
MVQVNRYEHLRSNPEFCGELKRNKIENGRTVYASYVYVVAPDYLQQYGFVSACVTNEFATLIQRYLDFCEKWTSEHI